MTDINVDINMENPRISPQRPEFQQALEAILFYRHVDKLVTYALRRHGFGTDAWGVTYYTDLEEYEKEEYNIPEGFIEITFGPDEKNRQLISEENYIEILLKVCEKKGMFARAELLQHFLNDRSIVLNIREANPLECNKRWKAFAPYLLKQPGWQMDDNKLIFKGGSAFYINNIQSDLDVLYRYSIQQLNTRTTKTRKKSVEYQTTIIKALKEFFISETNPVSD